MNRKLTTTSGPSGGEGDGLAAFERRLEGMARRERTGLSPAAIERIALVSARAARGTSGPVLRVAGSERGSRVSRWGGLRLAAGLGLAGVLGLALLAQRGGPGVGVAPVEIADAGAAPAGATTGDTLDQWAYASSLLDSQRDGLDDLWSQASMLDDRLQSEWAADASPDGESL